MYPHSFTHSLSVFFYAEIIYIAVFFFGNVTSFLLACTHVANYALYATPRARRDAMLLYVYICTPTLADAQW